MYTRRRAFASLGTAAILGTAGCSDLRALGTGGERDDPFEPEVTPEPLPDDAPLPPGIGPTDEPPYVEIEDHLAVSEVHMAHLDESPAFRIDETVTTTSYSSGAEVVDWDVEGDAENVHTTRRETTVTDAASLKTQRYDYTNWPYETMYPQQAFELYIDYTEYFAVDAHVFRVDADYEPLDVEEGYTENRTTRYSEPAAAERAFREKMRKLRDPRFGLSGDVYGVERVGGVKLKTYLSLMDPDESNGQQEGQPYMDRHEFNYWLFDDAGFIRERRRMTVVPQDREQVAFSAIVETQRWVPLEESPGALRPAWAEEVRGWEYPEEWWDGYDGPQDE